MFVEMRVMTPKENRNEAMQLYQKQLPPVSTKQTQRAIKSPPLTLHNLPSSIPLSLSDTHTPDTTTTTTTTTTTATTTPTKKGKTENTDEGHRRLPVFNPASHCGDIRSPESIVSNQAGTTRPRPKEVRIDTQSLCDHRRPRVEERRKKWHHKRTFQPDNMES